MLHIVLIDMVLIVITGHLAEVSLTNYDKNLITYRDHHEVSLHRQVMRS